MQMPKTFREKGPGSSGHISLTKRAC